MAYHFEYTLGSHKNSPQAKKAKFVGGLILCLVGVFFAGFGSFFYFNIPSSKDFTKIEEFDFSFYEVQRNSRFTQRKMGGGVNSTKTTTVYIPTYLGEIHSQTYIYEAYNSFSSKEKAEEFSENHPTMMVDYYLNQENQYLLLENGVTIEDYFHHEKIFYRIFMIVGATILIVWIAILCYPAKKSDRSEDDMIKR